jgi:hypothetical protein
MALPTPNTEVTAKIDPQPIADAISEALERVFTPLMGRLESLAGTMSVEVENIEEIAPDAVDADPIAQAQLEMQQVMAERLEGILNWTRESHTKLHSMHYDSLMNRKNQATLEEIRDTIRDEMDAIAMKLEQPAEEETDADVADVKEEGSEGGDAERATELELLEQIADNTKVMADGVKEAGEGMPEDDGKPDPTNPANKNAKGPNTKKEESALSKLLGPIRDFAKQVGKIFLVLIAVTAAVFAANDSVFVKLKELFERLVAVIAPILEMIMERLLPPLLDAVMMLADVFMQIVEALMPPLLNLIDQVLPPIMDLLMMVIDVFMQVVEMLMPPLIQIIEAAIPPLIGLIELISQIFLMLVENLMPILEPMIGFIADTLVVVFGLIGSVIEGMINFFKAPMSYIDDGLSYLADGGDMILSGIGGFINGLIEFVAGLVENIPFVGEGAAESLRGMKVSFGERAEARMAKRATERAERAADRVVDEVDFDLPIEEFKASLDAQVEEGNMSPEVASILMQRKEDGMTNENKASGGGDSGSDATPAPSGSDAPIEAPEFDAEKLVQVTVPNGVPVLGGKTIYLSKSPDSDGNLYAYDMDGNPIGKLAADTPAAQILMKSASEEGVEGTVAQDTSIDGTAMPVDAGELPTGGVAIDTATQQQEEAQSSATSSDNVNISPIIAPTTSSSTAVVNKNTTGIIYTGGKSSLGGRNGPGLPN